MLGRGLIDEVDRLVGQEPARDVAVGQPSRRHQRLVGDLDLVMRLVPWLQPAENLNSLLDRRFVDEHGSEAPLERRVLLDVLAVLVQGGGADDAELAPGEGGLHHGAGVDGALSGTGAHHLMNFVDEDDNLALGALDLVDHRLEALLELAAELGAGDHGAHVQRQQPAAAQVLGHIARGDLLRQAFDDGRLADARLADNDRVVLGAPVEDLHNPLDFVLTTDDGVELALGGEPGQVDAVLLERAVLRFRGRAVDAGAAAHFLERAVDALLIDVELPQDARRVALALVGDGDEQVLDADVLVLEALGLGVRRLQHADDARCRVDLHDVVAELRRPLEDFRDTGADVCGVDAHPPDELRSQAIRMLEERQEDVLDVPLGVALLADDLLGGGEHLLRLLGESVLSHHDCVTSAKELASRPCIELSQS